MAPSPVPPPETAQRSAWLWRGLAALVLGAILMLIGWAADHHGVLLVGGLVFGLGAVVLGLP